MIGTWPAAQEIVVAAAALAEMHRNNTYAMTGSAARVLVLQTGAAGNAFDSGSVDQIAARTNANSPTALVNIMIELEANVYSAMDRRIALEMGCSLPIKNSPMVDHQKETPDFVLGRWILKPTLTLETDGAYVENRRFSAGVSSTVEHQRARDRVVYHHLQPQQKLQVLRVRLFARIRAFEDRDDSWTMRVIELPMEKTDWWHARLHFVSKD